MCTRSSGDCVLFSENKIQQVLVQNHAVQIKSHTSVTLLIFNPLIAAIPYIFLLGKV